MERLKKTYIKTHWGSLILSAVLTVCIIAIASALNTTSESLPYPRAYAQSGVCTQSFQAVATPLTDLGANEYYRRSTTNPPTYTATGLIGGLYADGLNTRPAAHDAAGSALAEQIQPLDNLGNPNTNGKIGMTSIGMSNTNYEFGTFITSANADVQKNPQLVLVNGAEGGGTIDRWLDPTVGPTYWNQLDNKIISAGLTNNQIQVIWLKITTLTKGPFPTNIQLFQTELEELSRQLKTRFPNLKITYLSSRTRSYLIAGAATAEPTAYDNAFAIRGMILKQISGDMSLNYNPNLGAAPVSYMAWGPYLWIDGTNPRLDGRTWPATNLASDCIHPSTAGNQAVTDMLMQFFKSDSTSTPWFLAPNITTTPTPSFSPTPPVGTTSPTMTPTHTPTPTATRTPTPSTAPTNTPPAGGEQLTHWNFDTNSVNPSTGSCSGCVNSGATWSPNGKLNSAFEFDGVNDTINLGTFPYFNSSSIFSLTMWVRPNFSQTETTPHYLLSTTNGPQLFYLSNINDWRFSVRTSTGTHRVDSQNLTWTSGTWHHVAITYDGSQLKFYWDGALNSSQTASGTVSVASGSTYLGAATINSNYFPGTIDEIRVYGNRTLSPQDVQALAAE